MNDAPLEPTYCRGMTSVEIRGYEAATDLDSIFELWNRSLGRDWPVDCADLAAIVQNGFVAVSEESIPPPVVAGAPS